MGLIMSKQELMHAVNAEVAKASPPAIVAATAQLQSWTAADLVTVLTVVYLVLQIAWLLWRWWKSEKTAGAQT